MASTLQAGIGAWYDDQRVEVLTKALSTLQPSIDLQQRLLSAYGYKIERQELNTQSQLAVRAFQMHFRPSDYSGFFDTETLARLISLLERYRPEALLKSRTSPLFRAPNGSVSLRRGSTRSPSALARSRRVASSFGKCPKPVSARYKRNHENAHGTGHGELKRFRRIHTIGGVDIR